jgi:hypothetical protein
MNYHYHQVQGLRCVINPDLESEQGQLFQTLRRDVQQWDPNE